MHTYIYTYIHTYIHACMHTYIRTYMHASKYVYIHTCIPTCIHACLDIHMHVQCGIHTHIHGRIRVRTHTYILAYIHSYTHTSVHACVRVRVLPHVHTWRACKHTYMTAGAESTGAFRAVDEAPSVSQLVGFGVSQRDECCKVFSVYFLCVIAKIVSGAFPILGTARSMHAQIRVPRMCVRGCYAGADSTVAFGFVDDAIVWLRRCVL